MRGTDWTAPGKGATVAELLRAFDNCELPTFFKGARPARLSEHAGEERTNLRLTGRPIDEYDCTRIRAAEVDAEVAGVA